MISVDVLLHFTNTDSQTRSEHYPIHQPPYLLCCFEEFMYECTERAMSSSLGSYLGLLHQFLHKSPNLLWCDVRIRRLSLELLL